ncbi:MAG TPA: ABC transporter permease [Gammaproteobacteria bacterium]|nr:ABC transporter permease [Gammaproteobacteria bacterium]
MNGFLNDLRFGLRQLATKPGFAVAAILTLALGIGANTAVFSVLNDYLLKPLPYPHSEQLTNIYTQMPKFGGNMDMWGSLPLYDDLRDHVNAFSSVAAFSTTSANLRTDGRANVISGVKATGSLFKTLGVKPLLGRTFTMANDRPGQGSVVVISYHLWQSKFGGDPNIIGRAIKLNEDIYRIRAVMPPGFEFPSSDIGYWAPLTIKPAELKAHPMAMEYQLIGRLAPHATRAELKPQIEAAATRIRSMIEPARLKHSGYRLDTQPLADRHIDSKALTLLLLQAAVLLVLLIACINVASLLLARILGRGHEMAMRSALGASRAMLARQLVVEAFCLAVPGGLAGIGIGWLCLRLIRLASSQAGNASIDMGWRVGLFALCVVCGVGLLVSVLPIFHLAKTDLQNVLQEGGRTASGSRGSRRVRGALVAGELALATALLASAGLLLHSFVNVEHVDPGFNINNMLTARVFVPPQAVSASNLSDTPEHREQLKHSMNAFRVDLLRHVRALPSVEYAAVGAWVPLTGLWIDGWDIQGHPRGNGPPPKAIVNPVTSEYFKTLGIPLLKGHGFTSDTATGLPTAVVGRNFADKYFNGHAIGKRIAHYRFLHKKEEWLRIVGVAAPIKVRGLDKTNPTYQVYENVARMAITRTRLFVRTSIPPDMLIKTLRQTVQKINPVAALYNIKTMRQVVAGSLSNKQMVVLLLLAFGGIALALAVVGVYGVMSYAVGQRRAECGIRLALGALPENLLWLIIKDGLKLLGIGLITGLGLAVIFGFVLSSRLFGIAPYDPITLIGTVIVLAAITLLACWLPARRAARLDPAIAMMEQ